MEAQGKKVYQDGEPYSFQLTLDHILRYPLTFAPMNEIVYRDLVRYDYRTLNERVCRLAGALASLGVKQGDTVAVLDWDSHRYLECYFAIPMMGAVLHTINVRLAPEQILYTMNHAEDVVVLVNQDFLPLLEPIAGELKTVEKYVLVKDGDEVPPSSITFSAEYEDMLANSPANHDFPALSEDTRATIFYTTGTTGLPKGVHFSHRQLVLHTLASAVTFGSYVSPVRFRSDDVYMPLTPMFHVHAWGVPYTATLLGVKQVYPGRYEPEMLLKLILGERVTFSHCVPTIMAMIIGSPVAEKVDLSHWKVGIGGSALPRGMAEAALKLGIDIFTGYGMSETCPIIATCNFKEDIFGWGEEEQIGIRVKTGLPIPLVQVRLMDDEGGEVPPGDPASVGELVLRAPWLTQSYFRDEERSKELWRDGWLHTGDVAFIDSEGYINITDRLKDVIKTGGDWVSSLQIEDLLSCHDAVAESAVIGVQDEKWGERPLAFVVSRPDLEKQVSEKDLQEFMQGFVREGKINKWAVPDRIVFLEELPKTSVGKVSKRELRAMVKEKSAV
jgi:acyl-CoA synthetase (AMP-forming)/AMP-acid ligase II